MKSKEWTLMFYFASDNPLASTIVSQLKAIKDAGYHPDANVICHFDPHDPNTPTHIFDVNHVSKFWNPNQSEVGFRNNDPFIRDLVMDRLWGEGNETIRQAVIAHIGRDDWTPKGTKYDPPEPKAEMEGEQDPDKALESFLKFCRESYPARHYMLFILGHGQVVGNDNLLFDDHASKKALTLTKLGEVLRTFNADVEHDSEPGQVELIALHSCSMSAMEVAYELKGAANYMLASQGPNYVGNLPYKQILIRVFNDLNADIASTDISGVGPDNGQQSFVHRLVEPAEEVSKFIREKLSPETQDALKTFGSATASASTLLSDILEDLNKLLPREDIHDELLKKIHSNGASNGNGNGTGNGKRLLGGVNRKRFNRHLLADVFPELSRFPRQNIETMLRKIFYYSLYNSYDFQLAGYPYDLCLTNLNKVPETEEPINQLADTLMTALNEDPMAKQLILLAHWDAQSFYQEDYVDLYDFCFSLTNRTNELVGGFIAAGLIKTDPIDPDLVKADPTQAEVLRAKQIEAALKAFPTLEGIVNACNKMKNVLEKGSGKLTTLAAFAGPAFQYSHGHSIFFPWTRPTDRMWETEYEEYRLNEKTRWRKFLDVYFKMTMRKTREDELGEKGKPRLPEGSDAKRQTGSDNLDTNQLLALIGQIGAHVFAGDGSLSKPGPDAPMGSRGPDDPAGASNCTCPTIKNYPSYTSTVKLDGGKEVPFHASEDFLEGQLLVRDSNGS